MHKIRVFDSFVTRLLLLAVILIVVASVLRYHAMERFIRHDLGHIVSVQQEALARDMAHTVDYKILERQHMLKHVAQTLPEALLKDPVQLRAWLGDRYELHPVFSQGFFVADLQGASIADFPERPERIRVNYADRDYFQGAATGTFTVGRAVMGRVSQTPVLPMAAPIRDAQGKVVAVLAGVEALNAPGFLDAIHQGKIGETGGYLLISPKDQIFIAATKPGLVLQPTAAPGVNVLHDQALAGFRGSGITVNAQGVEEIAAFASVPSTGWFVVGRLPTAEALMLLDNWQRMLFRASALGFVAVIVLLGGVLYWSFRPLRRTAEHALRMAEGLEPMQPLAVKRLDEVGYLTTAFNTLLEKLVDTQAELRAVSRRDVLTGLSNRLDLADRTQQCIHRAQRHKTFLAALYMDLDNFKPVNDRLGHQAGDAALQEVARRLSALVREVDMLSRVGGDEFVLVLGDLGPTEDAARSAALTVASKCIAAMEQAMVLDGEAHQLGLSVGISVGDGNSTIDSLFSAADRAMYLAKKQGGNSYWVASADDPEGLGSPSGLGDI